MISERMRQQIRFSLGQILRTGLAVQDEGESVGDGGCCKQLSIGTFAERSDLVVAEIWTNFFVL